MPVCTCVCRRCGGLDAKQFKGVFVRHLMYALPVISGTVGPAAGKALAGGLLNQSTSILAHNSQAQINSRLAFGQLWQGPFEVDSCMYVSQGAALDALLAAYALNQQGW